MRAEAENNLLLGLAAMIERGEPGVTTVAPYFATGHDGPLVVGCAMRTPPYGLAVSRWENDRALAALVRDVAFVYPDLPGVNGPEPTATMFAEKWASHTGKQGTLTMRQRIFELRAVQPVLMPAGQLREAEESDVPVLTGWADAFARDVGLSMHQPAEAAIRERIGRRCIVVWDDNGPKAMASWTGKTPSGVRVNYVYTPDAHRRRGYATGCVAALSERLLRDGNAFCSLYTDLANPTSNAIYERIGYRPICEVGMYGFAQTEKQK